jgi:hypothetical protein
MLVHHQAVHISPNQPSPEGYQLQDAGRKRRRESSGIAEPEISRCPQNSLVALELSSLANVTNTTGTRRSGRDRRSSAASRYELLDALTTTNRKLKTRIVMHDLRSSFPSFKPIYALPAKIVRESEDGCILLKYFLTHVTVDTDEFGSALKACDKQIVPFLDVLTYTGSGAPSSSIQLHETGLAMYRDALSKTPRVPKSVFRTTRDKLTIALIEAFDAAVALVNSEVITRRYE